MDTVISIVQVLLAVMFAGAGLSKLTQPYASLGKRLAWVNDFSAQNVRLIGALEVCGAIGIVLPSLIQVTPILIPMAAVGLALVMSGAMATHLRRGEYPAILVNFVLLALALLVAYTRLIETVV